MKKLIVLVSLCLTVVACKPDEVLVAKVNGEGISKKVFEEAVARTMQRYKTDTLPPGIEERIRESVLRRMIDELTIELEAKRLGVVVSEADVDQRFKEHRDRFGSEKPFQDYLKRAGHTEASLRAELRQTQLRERVVQKLGGEVEVTDEEVSAFYKEHGQRFSEPERIRVSRIVVRVPDQGGKAAALAKANAIHKEVTAAGADFGKIAFAKSEGEEQTRSGEVGWIVRGRMGKPFDEEVFALETGKISKPFESKLGIEIVKVSERVEARQRPLEEVRQSIADSLAAKKRNDKQREVVRQLKKDVKVEKLITFAPPQPPPPAAPRKTGAAPTSKPDAPAPAASAESATPQP